jgi:hypothetical protein
MNKELTVKYGPRSNRQTARVVLNGFVPEDKLTPKMARAALRIAGVSEGEVWEQAQYVDGIGLDYSQVYGYRVYGNSARKVRGN